jgi:hypothetical protein
MLLVLVEAELGAGTIGGTAGTLIIIEGFDHHQVIGHHHRYNLSKLFFLGLVHLAILLHFPK